MMRRFVGAGVVFFALAGFVFAETYNGMITKIEKDEVTVTVRKKGEKKGEEKTFKVSKDVKLMKIKGKDAEPETVSIDDIKSAIDNAKGKVKGVGAKIETEGEGDKETVSKISIIQFKRKKADK